MRDMNVQPKLPCRHQNHDLWEDLLMLMLVMGVQSHDESENPQGDPQASHEIDDSGNRRGGKGHDHHGDPDEENCDFEFGECTNRVKYVISYATGNGLGDEEVPRYYCAQHFLLKMHWIIDSMETNVSMSHQKTDKEIRQAIRAYVSSFGSYTS